MSFFNRMDRIGTELSSWHSVDVFEISPYRDDQPQDNDSISFSQLKIARPIEQYSIGDIKTLFVVPRCLLGGDYSGSSVTRSNFRVFLSLFAGEEYDSPYAGKVEGDETIEGVHEVCGDFGSYGVAIRLDVFLNRSNGIYDCLASLESYCALDDQDMSFLEMEWADEDWECWAESDFVKLLEDKFDIELEVIDKSNFRRFFEEMREKANVYWESENSGMHVNIESVVKEVELLEDIPETLKLH